MTYLERNRCCVSHIYTVLRKGARERGRGDERESTTLAASPHTLPSFPAYTTIKAEQREPHDWHMTVQARGFALKRNHMRTPCRSGHPTVCSAHRPIHSSLWLPISLSSPRSFFFLLLNRYLFVCLVLRAWRRKKEKKVGVFKPPGLPRPHVTSAVKV